MRARRSRERAASTTARVDFGPQRAGVASSATAALRVTRRFILYAKCICFEGDNRKVEDEELVIGVHWREGREEGEKETAVHI